MVSNSKDNSFEVKESTQKGVKYWVHKRNGQIIERVKVEKGILKKDIEKAIRRKGFIGENIIYRQEMPNYVKIVTKNRPKKGKIQYKAEYDVYLNGKKLRKPVLEPYVGVSKYGLNNAQGQINAKKNAFGYTKSKLMDRGLMEYEDELFLVEVKKSYIQRRVKN